MGWFDEARIDSAAKDNNERQLQRENWQNAVDARIQAVLERASDDVRTMLDEFLAIARKRKLPSRTFECSMPKRQLRGDYRYKAQVVHGWCVSPWKTSGNTTSYLVLRDNGDLLQVSDNLGKTASQAAWVEALDWPEHFPNLPKTLPEVEAFLDEEAKTRLAKLQEDLSKRLSDS